MASARADKRAKRAFTGIQGIGTGFPGESRERNRTADKRAESCSAEHPGLPAACGPWRHPCARSAADRSPAVRPAGAGADAAVQPAHGGAAEGAAAAGEGAAAQDPEERGQDAHGHVQEEPAHQRRGQRRRAAREGQAGRGCGQGACERVQVTAQRPPPRRSPAPPPRRFLSSTKTPLTCPSAAWAPVTQTGPRVTTQCRVPISPEAGSQPAGEGLSVMGPRRAPEAAPLSPS